MISESDSNSPAERPFLGIYFRCCKVYSRIYKNKQGTAYQGHCPKCFRKVNIKVGDQGTSNRFFIAE